VNAVRVEEVFRRLKFREKERRYALVLDRYRVPRFRVARLPVDVPGDKGFAVAALYHAVALLLVDLEAEAQERLYAIALGQHALAENRCESRIRREPLVPRDASQA